ncbi:para-aminobenzoate synthetase component 1 [Bradyrhizobium huanghuaihaiense]|jgi:para-aminobenzoate synthetase component I|uniref:aminodeoxychorismate synthase n=2 Tax=Bradyrhizobium TaxID=374 RepID=A0A837CEL9_9BRAD|nr:MULTISPECIES: aminodeoxychorismate synthase component I [Bradyrhizobium]KGJ67465.1 putative para-aminobenzoate synthase component I [Bradyrhizobium diazoefficiens SEMIA 5080]KOY04785.1 para-aminobenzoate synthase [Bradyrhizobium diazoefficiens]MCD9298599.1 aminodeoxychorismate synthase component I [Bradyrhizobium diazoefficiens]MCD9815959.1 aminodeoxychorismate synthase component I [Bradyrhizobium diazoefficiens]MCD9833871.1 aminodeoxychorismate synthase component I [Bradyrhizobium diazoeff
MYVRELQWVEPVTAMRRLGHRSHLTFLDSAARHELLGRYSYLTCDPFSTYRVTNGRASWNGLTFEAEPWKVLRTLLAKYPQEHRPDLPPFQGGAAGYLAYDMNRTLERLSAPAIAGLGLPQSILHFYDVVISFDHRDNKCWIVSTGWPEQDSVRRSERALRRADEFAALLAGAKAPQKGCPSKAGAWHSNFSREGYIAAVQHVIDLILAGDVFQTNIAQRFSTRLSTSFDPLAFYCQLRSLNPAPFAALLRWGKLTIASSSPERFLKLEGRQVETRPIKGTIARSPDFKEDQRRAAVLLASEKDHAENTMIVDLLRNDLSRVCTAHSVGVPALCNLESYASVHHLVSIVTGTLAGDEDAVSLLRACFPGGSITGAPKPRSMEIITEIERIAREVYCGAIGFIGFNGHMDTSIAIRTVTIDGGLAVFHAGSGITALSEPEGEYEETLAKAARIFDAFGSEPAGAF